MNQTTNYKLNQWDAADPIRREDFNSDNAKLDAALGAQASAVAGLGNCEIRVFSYTGTGTYGADNPTRITFPKRPVMAFVRGEYTLMVLFGNDRNPLAWWSGSSISEVDFFWSGNTASIIQEAGARYQSNSAGVEYVVYAFYTNSQ